MGSEQFDFLASQNGGVRVNRLPVDTCYNFNYITATAHGSIECMTQTRAIILGHFLRSAIR